MVKYTNIKHLLEGDLYHAVETVVMRYSKVRMNSFVPRGPSCEVISQDLEKLRWLVTVDCLTGMTTAFTFTYTYIYDDEVLQTIHLRIEK